MTPRSLDEQIVDAGGLISLILVFVFAYLSAILPLLEDARRRAKPAAKDDQETLARRLSNYRALGCGLLAVVLLVLLLLGPLSWHALTGQLWKPFRTLRVGLLVIDVLLLATGVGIATEIILVTNRLKQLR